MNPAHLAKILLAEGMATLDEATCLDGAQTTESASLLDRLTRDPAGMARVAHRLLGRSPPAGLLAERPVLPTGTVTGATAPIVPVSASGPLNREQQRRADRLARRKRRRAAGGAR